MRSDTNGPSMITKLRAAAAEESGFTLVELLIVIAILGVLAGVVVFSVAGIQDNSQTAACKAEASTVRTAEEAYYVKQTPRAYGTGAQLVSARLLNNSPTLVSITVTTGPADYSLAWAGACVGQAGNP